jgi:hypothetical protein
MLLRLGGLASEPCTCVARREVSDGKSVRLTRLRSELIGAPGLFEDPE